MKKITKKEAGYKEGSGLRTCGRCSMYRPPSDCTLVIGVIRPDDTCKYFEKKTVSKSDTHKKWK